MRLLSTLFFTIASFLAVGQNKALLGKYTHSFFMYEYFLTLSDSGQFHIEERTDLGTKITVGKWTGDDKTIRLIPTSAFHTNRSKETYSIPSEELEESIISIGDGNQLTILAPKNRQKTKAEIPNYRLTRIENERLKLK
jgi:hypothetical protein